MSFVNGQEVEVVVSVSLLVRVAEGGSQEMLPGKGGWRKGLYRPFGVCTREKGMC